MTIRARSSARPRASKKRRAVSSLVAVTALTELLPCSRLHPAVVAWAALRPPREKWAIAFSGGADSLALLFLVLGHWPERRRSLVALHFNHRLRGAASRADAVFCRKMCARLGVRFVLGEWRQAYAGASEAEARAARMKFFERHSRVVWTGHQQDDIAESMLMRLARGSGLGGLAAPRPIQVQGAERVNVRPLLTVKKAEITQALGAIGETWREDATNANSDFLRNRMRGDVLPAWIRAASERDALAGAAQTRDLLEEDEHALDAWLEELLSKESAEVLRAKALAGRPRALYRRALRRWLNVHPEAGDLSRQAFETLLAALILGKNTRQSIGRDSFAVLAQGDLRLESAVKFHRKFQRSPN